MSYLFTFKIMSQPKNSFSQEIKKQISILGSFVAIFWILEILDQFVFPREVDRYGIIHYFLDSYGIRPHSLIGLRGILFAPFLHGDFGHLIGNTIPFLILGWLVMIQETSDFWIVTLITMIIGGSGTWIFGSPNSVHIGASSLVFGYLGFLLLRGYFQRNIPSIMLSLVVGFLYGGLIWGVLPMQPGISWQGHLFGFLGGVLSAKLIAKEKRFYS
jgi:membrane associated rhomboid family serine protease